MLYSRIEPPKLRLIATGGTAQVFESRDSSGNPAALKISLSESMDAGIQQELEMSRVIEHPVLLAPIQGGKSDSGRAWILLPLLSGQTLANCSLVDSVQ